MDKLIADKSRKIALFMGAIELATYKGEAGGYFDSVLFDFGKTPPDNYSRYYSDISMKYHKSWDWLMPVIHKCFEIKNNNSINIILFNQLSLFACGHEMDINQAFGIVGDIVHHYLEENF